MAAKKMQTIEEVRRERDYYAARCRAMEAELNEVVTNERLLLKHEHAVVALSILQEQAADDERPDPREKDVEEAEARLNKLRIQVLHRMEVGHKDE